MGEDDFAIAESAAVALEFIHCASLVHDDLPCFDDAELRRANQQFTELLVKLWQF